MHHPQGRDILNRIQITKQGEDFSVKFPAYGKTIDVTAENLKDPETVKASHPVIPIIERAYIQLPSVTKGAHDSPQTAMENIFGHPPRTELIDVTDFKAALTEEKKQHNNPSAPIRIWTLMKGHTVDDQGQPKADTIKHHYSVRINASTPEQHIIIANPYHTETPETVPWDQLQLPLLFQIEQTDIPAAPQE